jgi:hypothetical protein
MVAADVGGDENLDSREWNVNHHHIHYHLNFHPKLAAGRVTSRHWV